MKRSYDYSFVTDTNNISSAVDAHSFQSQPATAAAHHSAGDYLTSTRNLCLNRNTGLSPSVPTLELRVPLLASALGFSPDFQTNAGFGQHGFQVDSTVRSVPLQTGGARSRLAGLGIRYDGPLWSTSPFAVEAPLLFSPAIGPPVDSDLPMYDEDMDLSLHEICHMDNSPALGLMESLERQITYDDKASLHAATSNYAYSECPTLEYTAHSPCTTSLPSLSLGNSSRGYLMDDQDATTVKNSFRGIVTMYSPPRSVDGLSLSPAIGIFADVNLRELAAKQASPAICVNPAHISGHEPGSPSYCDRVDQRPTASDPADTPGDESKADIHFPEEAITAIVSVLSAANEEDQTDHCGAIQNTYVPISVNSSDFYGGQDYSVQPPMATRTAKLETIAQPMPAQFISPGLLTLQPCGSLPFVDMMSSLDLQYPPSIPAAPYKLDLQSPVLNAHVGITLDELRKRADSFRQRNPGMELDKTWLQAYAGRLSQRGELIEDYRCYVVGCAQRNKRRDHILVHVGAHVEHRPFQCEFCPMRFLRKNECKRHEASHGGRKPFSCPICAPYQDRSFVRQDLLKRHMRVTHGVQTDSNRRKRARVEEQENWH